MLYKLINTSDTNILCFNVRNVNFAMEPNKVEEIDLNSNEYKFLKDNYEPKGMVFQEIKIETQIEIKKIIDGVEEKTDSEEVSGSEPEDDKKTDNKSGNKKSEEKGNNKKSKDKD